MEAFEHMLHNLGDVGRHAVLPEEAVRPLPGGGRCTVLRAAVSRDAKTKAYGFLRSGQFNPGESSLYNLGCQLVQGESVRLFSPENLPPADVVKVDAEGVEVEFLEGYPHLGSVASLALEWHRKGDVPRIVQVTSMAGLRMTGVAENGRVMKFARIEEAAAA